MSPYDIQSQFPFQVQPLPDGKVALTIEIEVGNIKPFLAMLDSLSAFFKIINNKAKVALAYTRLESNLERGLKYYDEYCNAVIDSFKILRKENTCTTRELLPITLQYVKQTYPNASYDSVKKILTKSGQLKKNDFYKKNL